MAELSRATLEFGTNCRDCARREVKLPPALPEIGDDFDWLVRDYDGFRRFMLEDLAARFPERTRWTPADLEVVLVEAFAAALDQLSDMLDRVSAEAALETARRPDSVVRLLSLIGDDPAGGDPAKRAELIALWEREPERMEAARRAGPAAVHTQRRMVSLEDYAVRLEDHPLVNRAQAAYEWDGSWPLVRVAVTLANDKDLDGDPFATPLSADEIVRLRAAVEAFHARSGLPPLSEFPEAPTFRALLYPYLEAFRMLGQEVKLQNADLVGIELALSIRLRAGYFESEVRRALEEALGRGPTGFFHPGRLRFGEDLHVADVIQALMALDGVENVCVNRFKRLGLQFPDESAHGVIVLTGLEIAVCDNDPVHPDRGFFRVSLHGGRPG
ncbi:MAG TPA: hypothetical protein VKE95_19465 [Burkholderiales bacterium]|nr:hypothetical protein [Burkholderiales bacterium]